MNASIRFAAFLAFGLLLPAAAPLTAQHRCLANLLPNGDFEVLQPNRWTVTGNVAAKWQLFNTNGVQTTNCYQLAPQGSGSLTLTQPTPFPLTGAVSYEFSVDLFASNLIPGRPSAIDVGITDGMGRTPIAAVSLPNGTTRLASLFTAPRSANFVLDIQMAQPASGWGSAICYVDNAHVRPAQLPVVNFAPARAAGAGTTLTVQGPPSAAFVLFVGVSGFGPPMSLSVCQGDWLLTLPAYPVILSGLLNTMGEYTVTDR